jgi:hypothetical protein
LRRLGYVLGWFVVVDALITMFGASTAPLLVFLAADTAVAVLLFRSCLALRRYSEGTR